MTERRVGRAAHASALRFAPEVPIIRFVRVSLSMRHLFTSWVALLALCAGLVASHTTVTAESAQANPVEAAFGAQVAHVVDGDTIDVRRSDGTVLRVRVHGIDCPERGQPFARAARNFTRAMVFGQDVRVSVRDTDRYGRLVAHIKVGTRDLGESLVEAGLAWQFRRYSDDPHLASLEKAAREARRGVWQRDDGAAVRGDDAGPPPASGTEASFESIQVRGNVKSRVYHRSSCANYNCKSCTEVFPSEREATAAGFSAAKDCNL